MFENFQISIQVIFVGTIFTALALFNFSRWERPWILLTYAGHIVSAFVNSAIIHFVYSGVADSSNYVRLGKVLARMVNIDPVVYLPKLVLFILQQDPQIPVPIEGDFGSTTSMQGITALFLWIVPGDLTSTCVAFSTFSFFGILALYKSIKAEFGIDDQKKILVATMCMPSVVFWASGITKESIAMTGIGLVFLGIYYFINKRYLLFLISFSCGVILIGILKPYILIALAVASLGRVIVNKQMKQKKQIISFRRLVIAIPIIVFTVFMIGKLFPRFEISNLGEEAAHLQSQNLIRGGSAIQVGDESERSLIGQLIFSPVALFNSLFRPFIFESHNLVSLINSLETSFLLFLFIRALLKNKLSNIAKEILNNPILFFCLCFVFIFAVGVGISTTNLGTLSRYRMPLIPYWTILLFMLNKPNSIYRRQ